VCLVVYGDCLFRDRAVTADLEVGVERPAPTVTCDLGYAGLPREPLISARRMRARYYSPGLLHSVSFLPTGLGNAGDFELGVVVVPSGAGLVASSPS
jgi:hypothetical protein